MVHYLLPDRSFDRMAAGTGRPLILEQRICVLSTGGIHAVFVPSGILGSTSRFSGGRADRRSQAVRLPKPLRHAEELFALFGNDVADFNQTLQDAI
jgi:hypothetical protein